MKTLREWRKENGMRQADLARQLGVGQPQVSRVEQGTCPPAGWWWHLHQLDPATWSWEAYMAAQRA